MISIKETSHFDERQKETSISEPHLETVVKVLGEIPFKSGFVLQDASVDKSSQILTQSLLDYHGRILPGKL